MEAGSANSDYFDFQVLAYHRDFTMTIFLCECFLRLRKGCYIGCYRISINQSINHKYFIQDFKIHKKLVSYIAGKNFAPKQAFGSIMILL